MFRPLVGFLVAATAAPVPAAAPTLVCKTTVQVDDSSFTIELRPDWAPAGVERVLGMAKSGFFEQLPFFRMLPNVRATRAAARTHPHTHAQATVISHPRHSLRQFLVQFGISTSAEKQRHWQSQGNIRDDPRPAGVPFTDGILSFAGYGTDSRSTHLFITLGSQPGLGHRQWEVPVGRVVSGMPVVRAIYSGYGADRSSRTGRRGLGGRLDAARFE